MVLSAGQCCSGARASNLARSFFGPQLGCCRRNPTIASACAWLIAQGVNNHPKVTPIYQLKFPPPG
jgi:hypothetical protein